MESKKKNIYIYIYIYIYGSEEPRGGTGIKMQTWRMDLRTQGWGR